MITFENYYKTIKAVDLSSLPFNLQEGHDFVEEATEGDTTWDYYHDDPEVKAVIDKHMADLSDYLAKSPNKKQPEPAASKATEQNAREIAKKLIRVYVLVQKQSIEDLKKSHLGAATSKDDAQIKGSKIYVSKVAGISTDFSFPLHSIYNEVLEEKPVPPKATPKPAPKAKRKAAATKVSQAKKSPAATKVTEVEKVEDSVRFIKRYALLHGKKKTDTQILAFINSLQRAILEKRIRKTDKYASEVNYIQDNLVKLYNNMGRSFPVKLKDEVLASFLEIAGSEKVRMSTAYMKRYVGLQGKRITKDKAKTLHQLITSAIAKQKLPKSDPYFSKIQKVLSSLKTFIDKAKPSDTLQIHAAVLNGIDEALDGCCAECDSKPKSSKQQSPVDGLNGIIPEDRIMSSTDFAQVKFETLGFTGKWHTFMGDPAPGFTAMLSARPKMGKSYLCADFGGYLARHHGNTLIVAGEEKLGCTLQQKIEAVKHPCLHVTGSLPDDLSAYDFIILDSVTRLQLNPEDLRNLKSRYPQKNFIYVYQVTKDGKFRGTNDAEHDVDIVIRIPEKGKAVQMGRFNQGGEMDIFSMTA